MTMKTTFEANALYSAAEQRPGEAEAFDVFAPIFQTADIEPPVVMFLSRFHATCGTDAERPAPRADDHSRRSYALRRFDYAGVQIVEEFLKTLSSGVSPPGGRNRNGPG